MFSFHVLFRVILMMPTPISCTVDIATVSWKDIASAFPSDKPLFAKDPSAHIADSPQLVFLGIDERSSSSKTDTSTSGKTAAQNTQQSLPTKSDKDTSFQPTGQPYFAIDTLKHPDIATRALEIAGGESNALYMDLRAELLCLDFESTGVISAGRALSDWNRRSAWPSLVPCTCSRPLNAVCDCLPTTRPILPCLRERNRLDMGRLEARLPARSSI